jgi:hypothetical protein
LSTTRSLPADAGFDEAGFDEAGFDEAGPAAAEFEFAGVVAGLGLAGSCAQLTAATKHSNKK